jgi:hypothetical protein
VSIYGYEKLMMLSRASRERRGAERNKTQDHYWRERRSSARIGGEQEQDILYGDQVGVVSVGKRLKAE